MANKILAYPFSRENSYLIRQILYEGKYELASLVTLSKWCPQGVDANYFDCGKKMNIVLSSSFDTELEKVDTVLWLEQKYFENNQLFEKVKNAIVFALNSQKDVICCQVLTDSELIFFTEIAQKKGVDFCYVATQFQYDVYKVDNSYIHTPIVAVAGMSEKCLVPDMSYYITNMLQEEGYNVCLICPTHNYGLTIGTEFPECVYGNNFTEVSKIENLKNYLLNLQKQTSPDLFVIGIPKGCLPFNDRINDDYGIIAYEFFNAISPDFVIINLECKSYPLNIEQELEKLLQYRYNTHLDCLVMSNIAINSESLAFADSVEQLEYNVYDNDNLVYTMSKFKGKRTLYNIHNEEHINKIKHEIIKKLSC